MKITKEEAKKLLNIINEGVYDPLTGLADEPDYGYPVRRRRYRRAPAPAPTAPMAPAAAPGTPEDTRWMKYLPSFKNKEWNKGKTDDQLKPLILAWLAKQQKPTAESMLENEVKAELLETAGKLLQEAQKKLKEAEKGDIEKDQGKRPFMSKKQRRAFLGLDSKGKKIEKNKESK